MIIDKADENDHVCRLWGVAIVSPSHPRGNYWNAHSNSTKATILTYFIVGSKHDAMTVKLAVCALALVLVLKLETQATHFSRSLLGTVDTFVANHVVYSFFVTFRGNPHRLTNIPV